MRVDKKKSENWLKWHKSESSNTASLHICFSIFQPPTSFDLQNRKTTSYFPLQNLTYQLNRGLTKSD